MRAGLEKQDEEAAQLLAQVEQMGKEILAKDEESKKWKLINTQQPIWLRSKDDITEEEYHAFYKVVGKVR